MEFKKILFGIITVLIVADHSLICCGQENSDQFDALLWLHTFPKSADDVGKEHKWMWIQTDQLYFKFQLKACHSGHIALGTHPGDVSSLHYEVVLGKENYGIKDLRTNTYLAQNNGSLLSCSDFKPFWISWTNQTLRFGEGIHLDVNTKLDVEKYDAAATRTVSITTGTQIHGYWMVHKDMGRLITVTQPGSTTSTPNFDYLWLTFDEEPFIVVQVKMCSEAIIKITPFQNSPDGVDIRIGMEGNTKTAMIDVVSGNILTSVETLGILDCTEYKYFWFARQRTFIEFGTGSVVGDNRILYYDASFLTQDIGFATRDATGGHWQFKHITANFYTTYTSYDQRQFTEVYITRQQNFLELWVRGCKGALIALQSQLNKYIIVIGDDNNQRTTLQQAQQDGYIMWKIVESPGILDCYIARPFWVSWTSDTINFGTGYFAKNVTILSWSTSAEQISIGSMFVSTDDMQNKAEWRINSDSVSTLARKTDGLASFNHLWYDLVERTEFIFQVKVCSAAFISLSEFMGIPGYRAYELQIGLSGSDNKVILVKDSTVLMQYEMQNSLQCTHLMQYWVKWTHMQDSNSTSIAFGEGGDTDSAALFEYIDLNPYDINAVSVTTGEGHIGDWVFTHIQDNYFVALTDPEYNYKYGYFALKSNYFVFDVKTCSHLCFIVSGNTDYNNMANSKSIEFCIGINNNINSTITDMSTSQVTNVDLPDLLSCTNFRQFWIEWNNNNITVGIGDVHSNPFLKYIGPQDSAVLNPRFVHFTSGPFDPGVLVVPHTSFSMITMQTYGLEIVPVDSSFKSEMTSPYNVPHPSPHQTIVARYFLSKVTKKELIFSVRACQEAYITLIDSASYLHKMEVGIGVSNNTKTMITGYDITREATTDQILSCNEKRDFWVTWTGEGVIFGKGRIPGDQRIVSHQEPSASYSINMLSIATTKNYNGTWDFAEHNVDEYLLRTSPGENAPLEIHTKNQVFMFTLTISSDGEVILAKSDTDYYKLVIGSDGGRGMSLYKRDVQIATVTNKEYTSIAYPRNFWLTWHNNTINMGTGNRLHVHSVILWIDEDESDRFTSDIVMIKLSSPHTKGYWTFPKHYGNATVYHSPVNSGYYGLRSVTRNSETALFRVKTCNQALVALSDIPGVITERTLEIVIEDGTTTLKSGISGETLVQFQTGGGLLDCSHYRSYWLSWKNYVIELGSGNAIGDNRFLVYYLPDHSYSVNEFAVGTGESTGSWMFSPLAGDIVHAHTTLVFDWNKLHSQMWMCNGRKYVEFAVKVEKEARIALSFKPRDATKQSYEVVLGENQNTQAAIYYKSASGSTVENTRTAFNSLTATNYKSFWISWTEEDNHIRVGNGQVYTGEFMSSTGSLLTGINAVSFATGNQTSADWAFLQSSDDSLLVQSREFYDAPDFSFTVTSRHFFVFQVKSCHHAEVVLASQFGNENTGVYQIIIGANNNEKTQIKQQKGNENVAEKDTPGILSCTEYKTFWLSWKAAFIQVGHGAWLGENIIIEWQDPSETPRDVVQAFVNTGTQDIGLWELIDLDGESYTAYTGGDHTYDTVWFTPKHNHYIEFKAKACQDAHVAIFKAADDSMKGDIHYEIVIGASGNTNTAIRNESLTVNVAKAYTPEIMSCTHLRTFWVGWENGLVAIGFGTFVDRHTIVSYQDPAAFDVSGISFSTYGGIQGEFKFNEQSAGTIYLKGRDVGAYSYSQFWHTLMGKDNFSFRVKAADRVQVILTTVPYITTTDAYEFRMGVENNQKTELEKKGSANTTTVDSANILSADEFRTFWLSWNGGYVRLGTGTVIGEGVVIEMQDSEYNINAFSLTTQSGVKAHWEFVQDLVEEPSTTSSSTMSSVSQPSPTSSSSNPGGSTQSTASTASGQSTQSTQSTSTTGDSGNPHPPNSGSLSAGAIVGITFGVIGFIMIVLLGVILVVRLRQLKNYDEFNNEDDNFNDPTEQRGVSWDNPNYDTSIQLQNTTDRNRTGLSSTGY